MVVAHLTKAEGLAAQLPKRIELAQQSRAKLTDISGGKVRIVTESEEPVALLQQTIEAIDGAHFVGKGDRPQVHQSLCKFEWLMKVAVEQATADVAGLGLTVDPRVVREVEVRRRGRVGDAAGGDTDSAVSGRHHVSPEGQGVELLRHSLRSR